MLQRKGGIEMWLGYMFLFQHMCVQERGNEPFQWIRCINTAAIILSRFKIYLYSVALFHSFPRIFIHEITARATERAAWKRAGQEPLLGSSGAFPLPALQGRGDLCQQQLRARHPVLRLHTVPPPSAAPGLASACPPGAAGAASKLQFSLQPAFSSVFWRDLLFN